jgi:uncharacterized RDD family membrane protein YckC
MENQTPAPAEAMPTAAPVAAVSGGYAGFWRRVGAVIIDGIIVGIVFSIVFSPLAPKPAPGEMPSFGLYQLLSIVVSWLYFALMESSKMQATLGKKALGIKVTDLNGNKIGFGRATGRHFAKIISGIIIGIGYLMVAFTAKKQGLHDIIAGTLVVKKG